MQSFGEGHVVSHQTIGRRIEGVMKDYENRIVKSHDKALCRLNKCCMCMDIPLPQRGPRITLKNSSLFDVGKDTRELTAMENIFTKINRAHLLSQDIYTEYEEEQHRLRDQQNLKE